MLDSTYRLPPHKSAATGSTQHNSRISTMPVFKLARFFVSIAPKPPSFQLA